jgi:hypothetical protein
MSDELNTITFSEEEIIEIDFADYGFLLHSPIGKCEWTAYPLDEDEESQVIYAPQLGYTLETPTVFMDVFFTYEQIAEFERIRKDALKHPLPPITS